MLLRCAFVLLISILLWVSSSIFTPADSYWAEGLPEASTISNVAQAAAWTSPLAVEVAERQRAIAPRLGVAKATVAPKLSTLLVSRAQSWRSLSVALQKMHQLLWMLSRQWYALIVRGQLLFIEGYNP